MTTRKSSTQSSIHPPALEGLSATQRDAVGHFLAEATEPFRRADLTACLLPRTSPRSRERANKLAASALRQLAAAGWIRRLGHQHWIVRTATRTLRDGSRVPESSAPVTLSLTTRCPRKWLAVDLETGETWVGDERGGWRRETLGALKVAACAE